MRNHMLYSSTFTSILQYIHIDKGRFSKYRPIFYISRSVYKVSHGYKQKSVDFPLKYMQNHNFRGVSFIRVMYII